MLDEVLAEYDLKPWLTRYNVGTRYRHYLYSFTKNKAVNEYKLGFDRIKFFVSSFFSIVR